MYFFSNTKESLIVEMAVHANNEIIPPDPVNFTKYLTDKQKAFNITVEDFCEFISEDPYSAMMMGCRRYVPRTEVIDIEKHNEHQRWINAIWDVTANIMSADDEVGEIYEGSIVYLIEHNYFLTWESLEEYLLEYGHKLN